MRKLIYLLFLACAWDGDFSCSKKEENLHEGFIPNNHPTFAAYTPSGILVKYDPLGSVAAGYLSYDELWAAVDREYDAFIAAHPDAAWVRAIPCLFFDDYVYWVDLAGWAAGDTDGFSYIRTAIWSRGIDYSDPGDVWIKRSPDANYGTKYDYWRFTDRPLVPTIQHELGHVAYGPTSGH